MLRHLSDLSSIRLGEGCSSTAFGANPHTCGSVWNNHAKRGLDPQVCGFAPAVP
ncbi:MAG: hypothetical protein K8U57_09830 [Planctomycetes bacterium]|nr:hypothetical protein [Planctomycetota bacterium]